MCRDVSNNDTEELFAQRIFEIYTFVKFSNQILNHVTVFKEEVNSIKEFRKGSDGRVWKKLLLIFLIIVGILAYGVYWAFFDMGRLPEGEYIAEATSPNGQYTVKAYVTNGGATTSYAVRGELNFNQEKRKPKNIYWQYRMDTASIKWLDDDTVIINNIELDVPNDTYDYRRE